LGPALLTGSSDLPGDIGRAVLSVSLFGLAPCGVLPAIRLTADAVRSYRTFSPLPLDSALSAVRRAVYFLCHCPSGCPDRGLPGALPCGVRTFLPPPRPKTLWQAIVWPTAALSSVAHPRPTRRSPAGWRTARA